MPRAQESSHQRSRPRAREELVLLVGASPAAASDYFGIHLHGDFTPFSFRHFYQENQDAGFRVALAALRRLLCAHHRVAVLDGASTVLARRSILSYVAKVAPEARVRCIIAAPEHGAQQIEWRALYNAACAWLARCVPQRRADGVPVHWQAMGAPFRRADVEPESVEQPTVDEGFAEVNEVQVPLVNPSSPFPPRMRAFVFRAPCALPAALPANLDVVVALHRDSSHARALDAVFRTAEGAAERLGARFAAVVTIPASVGLAEGAAAAAVLLRIDLAKSVAVGSALASAINLAETKPSAQESSSTSDFSSLPVPEASACPMSDFDPTAPPIRLHAAPDVERAVDQLNGEEVVTVYIAKKCDPDPVPLQTHGAELSEQPPRQVEASRGPWCNFGSPFLPYAQDGAEVGAPLAPTSSARALAVHLLAWIWSVPLKASSQTLDRGRELAVHGSFVSARASVDADEVYAQCRSGDGDHVYALAFAEGRTPLCSCPFAQRSTGICKHIACVVRALKDADCMAHVLRRTKQARHAPPQRAEESARGSGQSTSPAAPDAAPAEERVRSDTAPPSSGDGAAPSAASRAEAQPDSLPLHAGADSLDDVSAPAPGEPGGSAPALRSDESARAERASARETPARRPLPPADDASSPGAAKKRTRVSLRDRLRDSGML